MTFRETLNRISVMKRRIRKPENLVEQLEQGLFS